MLVKRWMVVVLALAAMVPALIKSRLGSRGASRTAFYAVEPGKITVRVAGNVRYPGVYQVSANIMTTGAILLAEPVGCKVNHVLNTSDLSPLVSGSILRVSGAKGDSVDISVGSMPTSERIILGLPLDITTMTAADFDRLPGIGPVLAARIVAFRQINGGNLRPDQLRFVKGIGLKKYAVLEKYFN